MKRLMVLSVAAWYVRKGGGGNTAVFAAANGVVVVDAKLPGWREKKR